MDEKQWQALKKYLGVYHVEVYCCKICNDFSSTHKTMMMNHIQNMHPAEAIDLIKEEECPVTVPDTVMHDSPEYALAQQVAENEQIEKTILQILQTNSDISFQPVADEDKSKIGSGKENKRSKKNKKNKKSKANRRKVESTGRKNRKTCKKCGFQTKDSEEFKAHRATHYEDMDSRTCSRCQTVFDSYKDMYRHRKKGCPPNGPQVYKCEACGKTCNDKRAIIEHMVVHSEERPFACQICGKTYKTKKILRRHEGIHALSRTAYQCPECAFKTHWKTNINRHIIEVHKKETRPLFSCPHCPFTTPNKRYIEKHKFAHWKDCPYMCESCGKMFKTEIELETHKHTHVGQPDVAWQLIQLQNSEPQLVEESIVHYQSHMPLQAQEIQIHDHDTNLQGAVQVTMGEHDDAAKTIVLSQIPVVQYLDIVTGEVVTGQE